MSADPLLEIADGLYALDHSEFTAARDALAKELRTDDRALSARVKGLPKPSVAAWVVNLLVRREGEQVDQVLAVGAALRQAQADLAGEELRALTRQRRQVTAALTTRARALAKEAGYRVTESVAEQVEATLTAALLDVAAGEAVRSGLLVSAMATTGVDPVDVRASVALPDALGFVASAAPEAPVPRLRVVRVEPDVAAYDAAREEVTQTQERVSAATQSLDSDLARVHELEARALQLQSEVDELRRKIAELEDQAEEVDDELAQAQVAAQESQEALTRAKGAHDEAQARLNALPSP